MKERFVVIALALTVLALSIPSMVLQARDVDVMLYMSAAARANAEGALPYVAAWIEKGPVAMGLFQLLAAAFGPANFLAIALTWLALFMAGTFLVRELARELGAGGGANLAAVVFAVSLHSVGGSLNTEVPALVAAAAGMLVWLRTLKPGEEHRRRSPVFVAGLWIGVAFLCRQNAGALWALLVAAEVALAWSGRRSRIEGIRAVAALTAGFAALPFLVVAVYAISGNWEAFLFCFWGYNAEYYVAATHVTAERILRAPWTAATHFLWPVPAAALAGGVGIALSLRNDAGPAVRTMALAAVGLTLSMFAGLRFFSHYFALALPFWAVLGGWAADRVPGRARRAAFGLVLVIATWQIVDRPWRRSAYLLRDWVAEGGWKTPGDPLTWFERGGDGGRVARYLRDEGSPSDRVFVWGKRPHIYVYSRLVPATRFVTCTFLTGLVPWERVAPFEDTSAWIVPGAWDLLMDDLDRDKPTWIVDASHDHLFGDGAYAPENFPRLSTYLEAHYDRVREFGDKDRFIVWKRARG